MMQGTMSLKKMPLCLWQGKLHLSKRVYCKNTRPNLCLL